QLPASCFHAAKTLARVEEGSGTVTAIFTDGSRAQSELLIGADGINSVVRQQFSPAVQPRYAGYVAWRGIVEEADVAPGDRALVSDPLPLGVAGREMMFCVPTPGKTAPRAAPRRCCYVWYRPADYDTELPALCTDASGRRHGHAIPPTLIRREV